MLSVTFVLYKKELLKEAQWCGCVGVIWLIRKCHPINTFILGCFVFAWLVSRDTFQLAFHEQGICGKIKHTIR